MRPEVGQVIVNKYRLLRLIGDGGMGSVFEARHDGLGATFALKFLHPELSVRSGLVKRFLQEARVSAQIQSPHVVRVTDVDQTPEGLAFMVLEYLEGKTLQALYEELYKRGERLSYKDAIEYAIQILEGVEAAHARGVVHRDLKPDNVMITKGPKGAPLLKVLDFGIAKLKVDADRGLTRPGVMMGTPEYMAPEQATSAGEVDARADIFSLGVMIFEMLGGRRPVPGDDPVEISRAYLTGRALRLNDLAPAIAPDLVAAVHRAIAPQPRDRFASVAELRAAVEPFAIAARTPAPRTPGIAATDPTPPPQAMLAQAVAAAHGGPPPPQAPAAGERPVPATFDPTDDAPTRAPAPVQSQPAQAALGAGTVEASPLNLASLQMAQQQYAQQGITGPRPQGFPPPTAYESGHEAPAAPYAQQAAVAPPEPAPAGAGNVAGTVNDDSAAAAPPYVAPSSTQVGGSDGGTTAPMDNPYVPQGPSYGGPARPGDMAAPRRRRSRSVWPFLLIAFVIVGGGAGGGAYWYNQRSKDDDASKKTPPPPVALTGDAPQPSSQVTAPPTPAPAPAPTPTQPVKPAPGPGPKPPGSASAQPSPFVIPSVLPFPNPFGPAPGGSGKKDGPIIPLP